VTTSRGGLYGLYKGNEAVVSGGVAWESAQLVAYGTLSIRHVGRAIILRQILGANTINVLSHRIRLLLG